jgi:hypothetical protein
MEAASEEAAKKHHEKRKASLALGCRNGGRFRRSGEGLAKKIAVKQVVSSAIRAVGEIVQKVFAIFGCQRAEKPCVCWAASDP